MKLSLWRPSLLRWLQDRITVDSWSLTRPEKIGDSNGFLPPLQNVKYELEDYRTVKGKAIQEFYIVKRFPRELAYSDLPLATLEGLHSTLAIRLVHDYKAIADIDLLEFVAGEKPVSIVETGEDRGTWIIEVTWSFEITWDAEPEDGAVVQPYDMKQLNIKLWRDSLKDDTTDLVSDPALRVLDYRTSEFFNQQ